MRDSRRRPCRVLRQRPSYWLLASCVDSERNRGQKSYDGKLIVINGIVSLIGGLAMTIIGLAALEPVVIVMGLATLIVSALLLWKGVRKGGPYHLGP